MDTNEQVRAQYSCKRKSDYMMYLAVALFVLIIAFQLYLVLIIPIQLRNRNMFELQVARQEVVNQIDSLRKSLSKIETADSLQAGEISLVKNILDSFAYHVRDQQHELSREQVVALRTALDRYEVIQLKWKKGEFHIRREIIDYPPLLKAMEENLEKKTN